MKFQKICLIQMCIRDRLKTPIGMAGVAGIGMMIILWPDKEEEDEIENK